VIAGDFSPHKRKEVHDWCAAKDVEPVFLPAYWSGLNGIECGFAALRTLAPNDTDHRSHGEQDDATAACIRRRNRHVQPRRDFAVKPEIRLPDYLPYVA
jgi:hypothetical protein